MNNKYVPHLYRLIILQIDKIKNEDERKYKSKLIKQFTLRDPRFYKPQKYLTKTIHGQYTDILVKFQIGKYYCYQAVKVSITFCANNYFCSNKTKLEINCFAAKMGIKNKEKNK